MARIRTYDAPIDRIRPDDRGFAAQETAARRISFKTTEQVQNLREGGRLAAQNIRMQAAFDQEIAALQAGPQTRGGGGGGGSGGGGGGSRGSAPRQAGSTIAPRETAKAAAALASALSAGSARFVDVSAVTGRRHLLYELAADGQGQNDRPFGINNLWGAVDADPYANPLAQLEGIRESDAAGQTGDWSPRPGMPPSWEQRGANMISPASDDAPSSNIFYRAWNAAVDLFSSGDAVTPEGTGL